MLPKYFGEHGSDDDDGDGDSSSSIYHMPGTIVGILHILTWNENTQKAKEKI